MGGIYKYQNKITNQIYIGLTNDFQKRYNAHHYAFYNENSKEYNTELSKAVREYGEENFSYEILAKDIENRELLELLEQYYISFYNCQFPNGYNCTPGGNTVREWTQNRKEKFSFEKGKLTIEEIKELRLAYLKGEKPSQVYKEKYSNILTWGGFINIWRGERYKHIMPEVFQNRKTRYKLTKEQVLEIRKKYNKEKTPYDILAKEYGVYRNTIKDIITYKTWKNLEPVTTIHESVE